MTNKISTAIKNFTITNWRLKRILLNIIWGALNVTVLIVITSLIIGTGWEVFWLILILMYGLIYWISAAILFDAIIGDEFDKSSI
ncbi:hypothetical protein RXV94_00290 [Yeosuana sp. MJ-SS3]|uniref:Uncharacterized protein n=1 Tax=Gilvirhabdus luticola TaxID=3079858 RepID=A0ABU3U2K7_9FLAO|nr:hypothetical protein [Yeosuana sp. MJ-SS3]MDU8884576.1 hypothetical protein [Yeosuana sp. MJ-SS3]